MKKLIIALLLFSVCIYTYAWASGGSGSYLLSHNYTRVIKVGTMDRRYLVHVPASYNTSRPMPLVLNFHGGGGAPESQKAISGMDKHSDKEGYIAVYPEGTGQGPRLGAGSGYTWNAGNCCGWAQYRRIDDVAFVKAMIAKLRAEFNIDPKRIYATGFSNGAMLCYRLACEMSDQIAAIAGVSAPMGMSKTTCKPSRPISVMHFHGTADEAAPYNGGVGDLSFPGQNFMPVEENMAFWVSVLNLDKTPTLAQVGQAYSSTWGSDPEVILWKLVGAGHTWPGGMLGDSFLGKTNRDISANQELWKFFQRHPIK